MRLGQLLSKTIDEKGYERRERVEAIVDCPKCGKAVALISGTEAWEKHGNVMMHTEYDCCPSGECCGQTIIYNGLEGQCLVLKHDDGDVAKGAQG